MAYFGHFMGNLTNILTKTLQFVPFRKDFHKDYLEISRFGGIELPFEPLIRQYDDLLTTTRLYMYYSSMVYTPTAAVILDNMHI